jgi:hypothetical protein
MTRPRGGGGPPADAGAVLTIDVAHPPLSSDEAERLLDDALRSAVLRGSPRVIRVIHGYGSGGRGGTLKTAVRNWAYRRRAKLALVVAGEKFSPFDPDLLGILSGTGVSPLGLEPVDQGCTLVFPPR